MTTWFMDAFLDPIMGSSTCSQVAFTYTWRNSDTSSYWVPLEGQTTFASFVQFSNSKHVILGGDPQLL